MANTVIQLKYSTVTSTPTALNIGEPAYSYTSNTFFIGSPDGTGSIAIGGKFYLDQQQSIYNLANAAFDQANSAGSSALVQYAAAHANAAFDAANTNAGDITVIEGVNVTQNTNITTATNTADAAFIAANGAIAVNETQNNSITASFAAANTAQDTATAAFIRANNSIDANNGGTITGTLIISGGDLEVSGNLIISGETITQNVSTLNISDPLIYLAANNYSSDLVDIGFVGNYYDGATQRHAGLVRHAADGNFYLFSNYDEEPNNNIIDINDPSFVKGTLYANLSGDVVTVGGVNLKTYTDNAYAAANSSQATADAAFLVANNNTGINATQNTNITTAQNAADAAFLAANSAQSSASAAFNHANAAFDVANTDVTGITITAADYGTASETVAFRVEANGRISSANSTSIAIAASQITSGTLGIARGGTGATTFTTNGVLLGQGTSAISTVSSSTEGHILTINDSGVPTFTMLQGGTF